MEYKRPPLGTKMYSVHEHLYYDREKDVAPLLEYVILEGEVVDFLTRSYTEVCLKGKKMRMAIPTHIFTSSARSVKKYSIQLKRRHSWRCERQNNMKKWAWSLKEPLNRPWAELLR